VFGIMDDAFTKLFNLTLEELDYMGENMSVDEIDILWSLETFTSRRKALEVRNKYLKQMQNDI
jgi:hypothetical protein